MEFTYKAYTEMIFLLKNNGYNITDYKEYHSHNKPVILRHDVDYSLPKALELAKVENKLGVKSIYFVMISSDLYNVFSETSIKIVNQIHNLGHEIGLHFDEVKYHYSEKDWKFKVEKDILNEISLLQECTNIPIASVSMHRPSEQTLNADFKFDGIINSYGKTFFSDFKYFSDSRRHWREDVKSAIVSGEFDKLHILTHAFWYNENELDIHDSVSVFINSGSLDRYNIFNANITNLNEIMDSGEVN